MGVIRRDRSQGGAVAVEMALLLPLLVILVMGIIDVGRVVFTQISVQDAAQEGALFAAYEPDDPAAIRERVQESVDNEGPEAGTIAVSVACPGGRISISVNRTVTLITPFMTSLLGTAGIELGRTITAPIVTDDTCVAG